MLVYRVEFGMSLMAANDHGSFDWTTNMGPYQGWICDFETTDWLDSLDVSPIIHLGVNKERHPAPRNDFRLCHNMDKCRLDFDAKFHDYHFCFGSLQKLSKWFDKDDRYYMDRCGFVCMVYEAEDIIPGKKQSMFRLNSSTPVRAIRLSDIY